VIIAHNHPRGTAQPSKADIEFTESLIMSLAVNESKVLDHIIIGEKGEVFSFKRHGKLDERTRNLLKVIKFEKLSMSFAKYTIE
jgi:proteasome lid subunit RPN8/RPN11